MTRTRKEVYAEIQVVEAELWEADSQAAIDKVNERLEKLSAEYKEAEAKKAQGKR